MSAGSLPLRGPRLAWNGRLAPAAALLLLGLAAGTPLIVAREGGPLVERVFRGPSLDRPVTSSRSRRRCSRRSPASP